MAEYQAQETLNISTGKYRIISFFKNVNKALPFDGNEVEIYTDGFSMFLSLLRSVYNAKHHIHIEFYIIENDPDRQVETRGKG